MDTIFLISELQSDKVHWFSSCSVAVYGFIRLDEWVVAHLRCKMGMHLGFVCEHVPRDIAGNRNPRAAYLPSVWITPGQWLEVHLPLSESGLETCWEQWYPIGSVGQRSGGEGWECWCPPALGLCGAERKRLPTRTRCCHLCLSVPADSSVCSCMYARLQR